MQPDAKVVYATDVGAGHVLVVVHLLPVGVLIIERTVRAAADAALGRVQVSMTLRLRLVIHLTIRLQVLNAFGRQLDELIDDLLERDFPSEQAKLAVHFSQLCRANDSESSINLSFKYKWVLFLRYADFYKHYLLVRVDYKRHLVYVLLDHAPD